MCLERVGSTVDDCGVYTLVSMGPDYCDEEYAELTSRELYSLGEKLVKKFVAYASKDQNKPDDSIAKDSGLVTELTF